MSDQSPPSDDESTLYDPPSEHAKASESEGHQEEIELEISKELADQLLEVAQHLGLNPSILASRAVGLICDEISLLEDGELTSGALIEKYQTRLDLLQSLDYDIKDDGTSEEEGSLGWGAVDEIIQEAEEVHKSKNK